MPSLGLTKKRVRRKQIFLAKHSFTGTIFKQDMDRRYFSAYNTAGRFCEPGSWCDKKHVPFFCMKPFERAVQFEHVKKNKTNIAINGNAVRDVPDDMKMFVKYSGHGEL